MSKVIKNPQEKYNIPTDVSQRNTVQLLPDEIKRIRQMNMMKNATLENNNPKLKQLIAEQRLEDLKLLNLPPNATRAEIEKAKAKKMAEALKLGTQDFNKPEEVIEKSLKEPAPELGFEVTVGGDTSDIAPSFMEVLMQQKEINRIANLLNLPSELKLHELADLLGLPKNSTLEQVQAAASNKIKKTLN